MSERPSPALPHRAPVRRVASVIAFIFAFSAMDVLLAENFRLVPMARQVELGNPVQVYLQSDTKNFDASKIEKVESDADPDKWHLSQPWAPVDPSSAPPGAPADGVWTAWFNAFETGEISLPKTKVYLKGAPGAPLVESSATTATLRVVGVRKAEDKLELAGGLRPPENFPRDWKRIALKILAALAGLTAAWFLWRWWRGRPIALKPAAPEAPPLPPGVWALAEIERLRKLPVCETGPAKDVFSMASEVLRVYVHRRFGVDAIDMTTQECVDHLKRAGVRAEFLAPIGKFLAECDVVKFSKFEPPVDRWPAIWDAAKEIVLASTPRIELDPSFKPAPEESADEDDAESETESESDSGDAPDPENEAEDEDATEEADAS